jgi:hypothetical protein
MPRCQQVPAPDDTTTKDTVAEDTAPGKTARPARAKSIRAEEPGPAEESARTSRREFAPVSVEALERVLDGLKRLG